jgi:hypothetical protein
LLPAGGGQNAEKLVATGTLPSGQAVALKADGTVEAVAVSPESVGSAVVFEAATSSNISTTFDSASNKVVIAYKDAGNSGYGTATVGTVSGSSISFGTPVVFVSTEADNIAATFDSTNNKIVIAFRKLAGSDPGTAVVGTVSGTSISFGSEAQFNSGHSRYIAITYDSSSEKVVVAYEDADNSRYGTAAVGTVSGTSISFGSEVVFSSTGVIDDIGIAYDSSANKVVIAYRDNGNNEYGTAIVGTVSGTSISFGSSVAYTNFISRVNSVCYDSTNAKIVIAFHNQSSASYAIVGTVSGTSISFGTSVVYNAASSGDNIGMAYVPTTKKIVITYTDVGNSSYGTLVNATVSGTSISFSSELVFSAGNTTYPAPAYTADGKVAIAYKNQSNSSYGTGVVFSSVSSNSTDFIGITAEDISNGATGSVNLLGGINEAQSGLTIGSDYYVQDDGSLNTATSAVNYDIANASYTQAFSVASQETFPSGIAFNTDGTKMFITGNTGNDINEYTLSTAYDVSSAVFVDSFDVSAKQAAVMGVAFNTDGTKMFIVGETEDTVAQYALSTGFDVSTASFTQTFSIASQETEAQSLTFNTDGTKMFIVGDTGNDISEYTLSSGFDVSTASFVDSFSLASQTTQPKEGIFNTDGTELYVLSRSPTKVFKYTLTAGFDVSTASYASVEFSVAGEETSPQGLAFSADGSKMYVCGDSGDDINQYATTSTATNSTTVLAGQAISATTINMRNLT